VTTIDPESSAGAPAPQPDALALSDDERRLHELGYAQELHRGMSGFSNFAVSFTIICILSGCLTLYGFGMNTGGPAVMVWGWPVVGLFTLTVGLGMAEVCSSFPTAGGLYYWAAKTARSNQAAWAWFTGWFNFLGQVAVTAGIDFGLAQFTLAYLNLQFGLADTRVNTIVIYGIVLLLHALLNVRGVRLVAVLNNVSVWWQVAGVAIVVGALALLPSHHQSVSFVFTHFVNNTGWGSALYVTVLGLLVAQYTFTGFDASAHMTEETINAARSGPRGIVNSILVSLVAGWVLLIGVTYAIQNYSGELASATGVPPVQVFLDALGSAGGSCCCSS
jgi:amino acid transporter